MAKGGEEMLVVTVEIWPGGNPLAKKVIHSLTLANVSRLAEISDYEGYMDGEFVEIKGHSRSDGAWELVRKAIESLRELPEYIWPDPHSDGYIDAWNRWYPTLDLALRDASAGVGSPWVLESGAGLISQDRKET